MPDSPPPETLAWLHHASSCGQRDAQMMLHVLGRLDALDNKYETQRLATLEWGKDVDKLMRWIDDHLKRIMALEKRPIPGFVDLAAPTPEAAPVAVPVVVSDALIKAECALSDIAEGEETNAARNTFEWAEQRCSETLAIIRPVMKLHRIRTSEWPPQPLPQVGEAPSA